jgi:hypothetical protein
MLRHCTTFIKKFSKPQKSTYMKRSFTQRMLADYPDWHDKPFQLTSAEIKEPQTVFEEFFNRHSLVDLRTELKELLTDALNGSIIDDPTMYIGIFTNLEINPILCSPKFS